MSFLANLQKILTLAQASTFLSNNAGNSPTNTSVGNTPTAASTELISVIDNLGDRLEEIPFTFLNTNNVLQSTNVANDVLIYPGVPVPTGYYGKAKDFNVIFGTTAGTVKLSIMDYNAKNKIQDYQTGLAATANGTGELVIDESNCIALLGQSAGAGTCTVIVSGTIKKKSGIVRNQ